MDMSIFLYKVELTSCVNCTHFTSINQPDAPPNEHTPYPVPRIRILSVNSKKSNLRLK